MSDDIVEEAPTLWDFDDDRHIGDKPKFKSLKDQKKSFKEKFFSESKAGFFRALKISSQIAEKLPNKNDNAISTIVKLVHIVQILISSTDNKSALEKLCARYGAVINSNKQFVNMFMTTGLSDHFEVMHRDSIGDNQWVVHLHHDYIGDFFFLEVASNSDTFYRDVFFHTKEADFNALSALLWKTHDGRVEVKQVQTIFGTVYQYMSFPYPDPPAFGTAKDILSTLKEKHSRIVGDNISRTYLFLGKPGVGKTTLAMRFATESGGKIMRLGATMVSGMAIKDLSFLLDVLRPNFVIVDDIDKASHYGTMPDLLTLMEQIKVTHPKVGIILTANKTSVMEESLLRPGRIDTIVRFKDPDDQDRYNIMKGYIGLYDDTIEDNVVQRISKSAKGMSGAWLKEAAIQLKYSSIDDVEKYVKEMVSFLSKADNDKEEEEEGFLVEQLNEKETDVVREKLLEKLTNNKEISIDDLIEVIENTAQEMLDQRNSKDS